MVKRIYREKIGIFIVTTNRIDGYIKHIEWNHYVN